MRLPCQWPGPDRMRALAGARGPAARPRAVLMALTTLSVARTRRRAPRVPHLPLRSPQAACERTGHLCSWRDL